MAVRQPEEDFDPWLMFFDLEDGYTARAVDPRKNSIDQNSGIGENQSSGLLDIYHPHRAFRFSHVVLENEVLERGGDAINRQLSSRELPRTILGRIYDSKRKST